jgi:hypothetical protein
MKSGYVGLGAFVGASSPPGTPLLTTGNADPLRLRLTNLRLQLHLLFPE